MPPFWNGIRELPGDDNGIAAEQIAYMERRVKLNEESRATVGLVTCARWSIAYC